MERDAQGQTQPRMLDVQMPQLVHEVEKYAELEYEIKRKQEHLKALGEIVLREMEREKRRIFAYADEWGVRHRFEIVDGEIKLKHTRKGEAAE